MAFGEIEHRSRHVNRCEHREQDSQDQRDCKAANLVSTDCIQNNRCDQCCQVGIDNRDGSFRKTITNSHAVCRTFLQLFSNPFKDQHICVNRHTDRQYQSSQSRQCQWLVDQDHGCHDHRKVQNQSDASNHTSESIIEQDENQNQCQRSDDRVNTLFDGVSTQRCINRVLGDRLVVQGSRQLSSFQDSYQSIDFVTCEVTSDLALRSNWAKDIRGRQKRVVQDDPKLTLESSIGSVVGCQSKELAATSVGQIERYGRSPFLVKDACSKGQVFASNDQIWIDDHQGFDPVPTLLQHPLGLFVRITTNVAGKLKDLARFGFAADRIAHADAERFDLSVV